MTSNEIKLIPSSRGKFNRVPKNNREDRVNNATAASK